MDGANPLWLRNASERYGLIAMALHWVIALAILMLLAIGTIMVRMTPGSSLQFDIYQLHKSLGITVLVLSVARLLWRFFDPVPPLPGTLRNWEAALARVTHSTFYVLMIALPFSGWMMVSASVWNIPTVVFGAFTLPHLPVLASLQDSVHIVAATHGRRAKAPFRAPRRYARAHAPRPTAGRSHHRRKRGALMSKRGAIFAITVSLLAAHARAGEWHIDPAQSRLTFAGTQAGRPFEGSFEKFTTNVRFDESDPSAGEATVVIDMASVRTGNAQADDTVKGQDWLAVAMYPQARLETTSFRHLGGNRYQADAVLTIRGVAKPLVLAFTLEKAQSGTRAMGELVIDRTDFGVGQGQWASPQVVAHEVTIRFDLLAAPLP